MGKKNTDNQRIAKNTMVLYIRSLLMLVIGLYTSRLNLQVLGVDNFGIYNLIGGVVTMFAILYSSMSTSSQRYITYAIGEGDFNKLRKTFVTSVTLHFLIAIVSVILIEVIGLWLLYNKLNIPEGRMFAATWVLHCSAITTFIRIICVPYDSLIVAHEKMTAFAYISIYDAVMKLLLPFALMLMPFDKLIMFAIFICVIGITQRGIYNFYVHKHFEESKDIKLHIEKDLFKEMFSFAGWNLFGTGSFLLRNQGIDILLNMFFGVTVNAAKGVCNHVQNAVIQFVTNFQTAVNPQLTKSVAEGNFQRTSFLIGQGSKFSFFLLAILCLPIIVCTDGILSLWLVEVPQYASIFIQLTFIYQLQDVLSRFMINSIYATGNIKYYQILIGVIKLLALPITYIFLLYGGSVITGLVANIFLEIVCFVVRLYYNHKRIGFPFIKYLVYVVFRCWGVFVVALSISFLFKNMISDNIFITIPITVFTISTLALVIGLNNKDRYSLKVKLLKIIDKNRK